MHQIKCYCRGELQNDYEIGFVSCKSCGYKCHKLDQNLIDYNNYRLVPISLTYLDVITGEKADVPKNAGITYSDILEDNWFCDCNRITWFDDDEEETGLCLGCKRYLIIKTSNNYQYLDIYKLNPFYPKNLIDEAVSRWL